LLPVFAWCENRGLSLVTIRPFDVAAWVKELQQKHGAPGVKQQLAAVRMLFDWMVDGPGGINESGSGSAWAQARRQDRQDTGA
jgi:hypothetical protein